MVLKLCLCYFLVMRFLNPKYIGGVNCDPTTDIPNSEHKESFALYLYTNWQCFSFPFHGELLRILKFLKLVQFWLDYLMQDHAVPRSLGDFALVWSSPGPRGIDILLKPWLQFLSLFLESMLFSSSLFLPPTLFFLPLHLTSFLPSFSPSSTLSFLENCTSL